MSLGYIGPMDDMLCNISAFRYYRIPPQVVMLLPSVPSLGLDRNRAQLAKAPLISGALRTPVHVLDERRGSGSRGLRVVRHVWSGDLPPQALHESPLGFQVTSPLLTLLTMAPDISVTRLAMAMYEFCGTFSVFELTSELASLLDQAYRDRILDPGFGWRRMVSHDGAASSLWKRPPLIELDDLLAFASQNDGTRGIKAFRCAAKMVSGITASPLEVQASMLLGVSRPLGGEGLHLKNNIPLTLSRSAQRISGTQRRVADIMISNDDCDRSVIVECQGSAFHGSVEAKLSDSDRTTALQSMGYEVILTTYAQLTDPIAYRAVVKLIERKLGIKERCKTNRQLARGQEMRRDLFDRWESF